jgi:hypothetical protein
MIMQDTSKEQQDRTSIPNVLLPFLAVDELALLKRPQLARAISVSPRTVDNWQKQKRIPYIKLSARCIRYHLPSVLAALRKFEIREAGHRKGARP